MLLVKRKLPVLLPLVLEHFVLEASLLLEFNHEFALALRCVRLNHVMVVAAGAVLISIVELRGVLSEHLFTLFAGKDNLRVLRDFVVLGLSVALGAVEPQLATLSSDLHLGVQNVFAHPFL